MEPQHYLAGDPPPRPHLPPWKLMRCPRGGDSLDVTILSKSPYAIETHWNGTTRVLCSQDACPHDLHKLPKQWCAYFQACSARAGCLVLLEVPEAAYLQLVEMIVENGGSFRGLGLRMHRRGQKKNAPISIELMNIYRGVQPLPDIVDMWPMIMKLYKVQ